MKTPLKIGRDPLVLLVTFLSIPYWRLVWVGDSSYWWFCGTEAKHGWFGSFSLGKYKLLGHTIRDIVEISWEAIGQVYTHFVSPTVRRCRLLNTSQQPVPPGTTYFFRFVLTIHDPQKSKYIYVVFSFIFLLLKLQIVY